MVRFGDRHAAQEVGIYLVSRRGLARAGTRNQRLDPHHAHQPLHPLAIDAAAFLVELKRYPPRAEEWQFQMQFVDPAHQGQIVRLHHGMGAVDPRARHVQQRALPANR